MLTRTVEIRTGLTPEAARAWLGATGPGFYSDTRPDLCCYPGPLGQGLCGWTEADPEAPGKVRAYLLLPPPPDLSWVYRRLWPLGR